MSRSVSEELESLESPDIDEVASLLSVPTCPSWCTCVQLADKAHAAAANRKRTELTTKVVYSRRGRGRASFVRPVRWSADHPTYEMSTDGSKSEDQVERAIADALRRRADSVVSSEEEDDALISAVVAGHLGAVQRKSTRKSVTPWLVATGLLAAAAAITLWLQVGPDDTNREATTVAQADTSAPTQAMWVLEPQGTPLEGVVAAMGSEACGTRDDARACLTPGSRGTFENDGNLQLHEGTARVEAQGPIVLALAGVGVQATTDAANFSATSRALAWTVAVESGTVTVTDADGASQVLEAGESADSEPLAKVAGDAPQTSESSADSEPSEHAGASSKPVPGADTLLELARSQRAARDFAAAARTYEQLIRAHPNSPKVRATLVSLAQLYQGPLDDPAKALRHFDRYLERGGPLAEEAHYGKIRALRSLGRAGEAKTEVDAFLRTYPDSAYADALRNE